jgi:hypothetical protein
LNLTVVVVDVLYIEGHKGVVKALVTAGADSTLKMGDLSAADIARDFDHRDLFVLLLS